MITFGTYRKTRWRALLHGGGFYWHWRGVLWKLKAPWERALFSERNGYHKVVWRAFGWRLVRDPIEAAPGEDE